MRTPLVREMFDECEEKKIYKRECGEERKRYSVREGRCVAVRESPTDYICNSRETD